MSWNKKYSKFIKKNKEIIEYIKETIEDDLTDYENKYRQKGSVFGQREYSFEHIVTFYMTLANCLYRTCEEYDCENDDFEDSSEIPYKDTALYTIRQLLTNNGIYCTNEDVILHGSTYYIEKVNKHNKAKEITFFSDTHFADGVFAGLKKVYCINLENTNMNKLILDMLKLYKKWDEKCEEFKD